MTVTLKDASLCSACEGVKLGNVAKPCGAGDGIV